MYGMKCFTKPPPPKSVTSFMDQPQEPKNSYGIVVSHLKLVFSLRIIFLEV